MQVFCVVQYPLEQQIVQDRKQPYAKKKKTHQPFIEINVHLQEEFL